jgi:hypothetical protein
LYNYPFQDVHQMHYYPLHYPLIPFTNFPGVSPYPTSYHPNFHWYTYPTYRQFPDVDPTLFNESAIEMQKLMNDASIVLKKIAESKEFAKKVMSAAQESHLEEVDRLIQSTGIKSKVETSFNPDGINMKFSSMVGQTDCCKLTVALLWRG